MMRARRVAGVCGLSLLASGTSLAAQVLPRRAVSDSESVHTPTVHWQFDQCMGGLTYGAPLKWALSYGMGYVRESATSDWCVLGAAKIGWDRRNRKPGAGTGVRRRGLPEHAGPD